MVQPDLSNKVNTLLR